MRIMERQGNAWMSEMDLSTDQREIPGTTSGRRHSARLSWALGLTVAFLILEVIGAIWTGSLALLADAGHMLTDVAGISLSLLAIWFASKPPTPMNTYGYVRLEILAALANGALLFSMAAFILYEAYRRIWSPPEILAGPMLTIAIIGLGVNLASMWLLHKGADESLNLRGAYFEVLGDAIASLGVIAAALIIQWTGWTLADPLISGAIGLFILPRTWALLKDAVGVLIEGTPADVNIAALRESLSQIEGVAGVHDLHVWSLTSGVNAMSVHAVLAEESEHEEVLARVHERCTKNFKISHVTVQTERGDFAEHETHL